ncbi:chromate transporter [Fibrobacteres bacterium R8-0-B4]
MMILLQLLKSFLIIGVGAYGGGLVTIPMIKHETVTVHGWITASELSELIAVAQMTPGPIGVNAATYTGYRVAGIAGAAAATLGFVIPSLVLCLTLAYILSKFGAVPWMETLKKSVQPAVAGLIIAAVLTYGKAAVTDVWTAVIALAAFVIFILSRDRIHPALLILCGGIVGVFIY